MMMMTGTWRSNLTVGSFFFSSLQCNGIEILADILADEARDETVLSEAISVLAQVTAPWLDTNQSVADLHLHVDTFVAALTSE